MENKLREWIKGKIAVLTASTDGIGLACAKELLEKGAVVFISSRKEENVLNALDELKKYGENAFGFVCNAGNLDDIRRLVDRVKAIISERKIDILISNVGTNPVPFNKKNASSSTIFNFVLSQCQISIITQFLHFLSLNLVLLFLLF